MGILRVMPSVAGLGLFLAMGCTDRGGAAREFVATSYGSASYAATLQPAASAAPSATVSASVQQTSQLSVNTVPARFRGGMTVLTDGTILALRDTTLVRIAVDGTIRELAEIPRGYATEPVVSGDESRALILVSPDHHPTVALLIRLDVPNQMLAFTDNDLQGGTLNHDGSRVAIGGFIGLSIHDGTTGDVLCSSKETGIFNGVFIPGKLGKYQDVLVTTRVGAHNVIDAKTCKVLDYDGSYTGGTGVSTLSGDGKHVATGTEGGHDLELKGVAPFTGGSVLAHADCTSHVVPTWSRSGSVLFDMGMNRNRLASYDGRSGKRIAFFELPNDILSAAIFEDGRGGAVLYADRLEIVNAVKKKTVCKADLTPRDLDTFGVAVSPDQSMAAVSIGGEITTYDTTTCAAKAQAALPKP